MEQTAIRNVLVSQYQASLNMLKSTIEKIPAEAWNDTAYNNPCWQIAYHAIWGTRFYLGSGIDSFVPWEKSITGAESLGGLAEWENPEVGIVVEGYNSPEELLSFISEIESGLQQDIQSLPLHESSGFEWYPFTKLELHLMNIRHIQHHTAQLIERLKIKGQHGFPWAIDGNPPQEW